MAQVAMRTAIITVKVDGAPHALDLELPVDADLAGLARRVVQVFLDQTPEGEWEVEAHPPGRRLGPAETLAGAGVWDGAWLVVRYSGRR